MKREESARKARHVGCRISASAGKGRPDLLSFPVRSHIALNIHFSRCTMIRQLIPSVRWNGSFDNALICLITKRGFAATNPTWAKKMPDRPPPVDEDEFTESYLKGSGPGGQKIVSESRG